jgi:bisphosphoglycerate-independent phosphoglycerate mutase (AlkP superfamily)
MIKTFEMEKTATIQSKLNIEFRSGQILVEHQRESNSLDDDDSSIFLSFNKIESKKLFDYYDTVNVDEFVDNFFQHFTIYNSLKRFQQFFEKREINSLLSDSNLID